MGRAIKMTKPLGDPFTDLELVDVEKPTPGPGDVLIRVKLRTVVPSDLITVRIGHPQVAKLVHGMVYTPAASTANGVTPGTEGFGVVEEVGEGVTQFKPGQRVVPVSFPTYLETATQGSWQDYIVIRADDVYAISDSIDDTTAAQLISNPWTAFVLVRTLAAPAGQYIISTAAGSVVGRVIIQLAKHWGIKTINVVRHDGYTEELKALGADVVINSSTEDVVAKVMELTNGKGAFGVLDAVGGDLTKTLATCTRDKGEILVYGMLSGYDVTIGILDLARKVKLSWWILYPYVDTVAKRKVVGADILKLFEDGVLGPLSSKSSFPLADFKSALTAAEKVGRGSSKVLLAD